MLGNNLEMENYIKEYISLLKKRFNFSDKFEYSLIYYMLFKNDVFVKGLNIDIKEQKNVISIQIKNFVKNVDSVVEVKGSKHPYVHYDIAEKTLKYSYANEHNLFGKTVKIDSNIKYDNNLNIKTNQFMFYMFRSLEIITNLDLKKLDISYDFYNILCNKLAYGYITRIPLFEKFTPNKSIYFNVNSLTSYPSVVLNYLNILCIIAPEFQYVNYYFITGKYNSVFDKYNNIYYFAIERLDLILKEKDFIRCLERYITYIEAQSEPNNYEELNIQICDILLNCFEEYILNICKSDNIYIRRDRTIYVSEMLPYKYENREKKEIFRKRMESLIKKLEVSV